MISMHVEQIIQVALAFVFGGGISAVAARRMLKDIEVTGAETRVIKLLREEVERLSAQVERLGKQIDELTRENHELRAEILGHQRKEDDEAADA